MELGKGEAEPGRWVYLLTEARARTWLLVAALPDEDLRVQHDPLMSPIVWDLGHIGHFEDVWLSEKLGGAAEEGEGLRGIYNPFENPRALRDQLALPSRAEVATMLTDVRVRTLDRLQGGALGSERKLLDGGFVYHLVLQHEYQHNETILQTLQLKKGRPWSPPRSRPFPDHCARGLELEGTMVRIPGGLFEVGTDDRSVAYDNERPTHPVSLPTFDIDVLPVSNGAYLQWMASGGYLDRSAWSDEGWAWREAEQVSAPRYWSRVGEQWRTRSFDQEHDVRPGHPVCHVSYYEAEAFARASGKRLPTEFEWEVAAASSAEDGRREPFPWGAGWPSGVHANLDQLAFGTAPLGSFPAGASASGCEHMLGDVWEWTSSDFRGYPGFEPFPYREYSEVFFGPEYKVLRGGSWATRPGAIRTTFRNWDFPIRRQIFSGFRCARDA